MLTASEKGNAQPPMTKRRIHVLEIVGNAITGGMETYVRNLIGLLPRDEFRVTCIAPYESPFTVALRELSCDVFITPIEDDPPWRSIQMAVEVIRNFGVDLIHAHMPRAHSLAGIAGCFTQRPILATIHGMNVTTQELGIWRLANSHLIAVCQEAFSQALALGVPLEQVHLIPNGVDLDRFSPGRSGHEFRERFKIPPDVSLVGLVGRLDWEKSPNRFVEMAQLLHDWRPDVHYVLVGDGVMRAELEQMIAKHGLAEHAHLVGTYEKAWEVYPALDVLVNTSSSEGMPLTLLEGMACGLPVVAGRVGGIREIVEERSTGLLVGQGDIRGTAERVRLILDHPDMKARMGQEARRRAEQYFNLRTNAGMITDLMRRLVFSEHKRAPVWRANIAEMRERR